MVALLGHCVDGAQVEGGMPRYVHPAACLLQQAVAATENDTSTVVNHAPLSKST